MNSDKHFVITEGPKGTLTILTSKHFVIGVPASSFISFEIEELRELKERTQTWLADGGVLMFPFPVEVIDLRATEEQRIEALEDIVMDLADLFDRTPYDDVSVRAIKLAERAIAQIEKVYGKRVTK